MTSIMMEYYSNPEAVASTIQSFMNLSVTELKNNSKSCHNFKVMTSEIIETEQLDYKMIDQMNYSELITIIEMSRNVNYRQLYHPDRNEICTSEMFNLFNYKILLFIILGAARNCGTIRLFLELPIKSFYEYVALVSYPESDKQKILNDYNNLMHEVKRLHSETREDLTIKQLLQKINEKISRSWDIVDKPIKEYGQMILDELNLIRTILALTFIEAFPEHFDINKVKYKFSNILYD